MKDISEMSNGSVITVVDVEFGSDKLGRYGDITLDDGGKFRTREIEVLRELKTMDYPVTVLLEKSTHVGAVLGKNHAI